MPLFYEFAQFRIDPEKRLLWKQDNLVDIKPKTFDTLLVLIENRNKVVTKNELVERVWNGTAVSDDSLTQQISLLRRILGDKPKEHQFIATISGVGYSFVADVHEIDSFANNSHDGFPAADILPADETQNPEEINETSDSPAAHNQISGEIERKAPKSFFGKFIQNNWRVWAAIFLVALIGFSVFFWQRQNYKNSSGLGVRKIAVLPFKAVNETNETAALKQGMTDALITRLSRIENLTVLPTSLVAGYKDPSQDPLVAARELNVDAVLDGRIQKEGEKVRVTVQLIRSSDGKVLWSEVFLDEYTNIFDVQQSIAYKVAEALALELSDEEERAIMKRHTTSPEAYRLYLEGIFLFTNTRTVESRAQAQRNFQRAIELDPNFALAFYGLALTYMEPSGNLSPKESYKKSEIYARKALEIDPQLAEAYAMLGFCVWRGEWNWKEAELHFQNAIKLKPNNLLVYTWYALLLGATERFDQAHEVIDNSPMREKWKLLRKTGLYNFARNYDKCIETGNAVLAELPNDINILGTLPMCYAGGGMFPEAIEAGEKYVGMEEITQPNALATLGSIYAQAGKSKKAREIQNRLEQMPETKANIYGAKAVMYAALDEKNKAFAMLEKSIEQREWWGYTLKVYPFWDSLRDEPRFLEILRRINLK